MQCDLSYTTSVKDQSVIHAGFVKCMPRPRPGAPAINGFFHFSIFLIIAEIHEINCGSFERGAVLQEVVLAHALIPFAFPKFALPAASLAVSHAGFVKCTPLPRPALFIELC